MGGANRWLACTLRLDISIAWLYWREPNLVGCCFEILESMLATVTSGRDERHNFISHLFEIGLECSVSWLSHHWERAQHYRRLLQRQSGCCISR